MEASQVPGHDAAARAGAQRALACVGHELAGPISALYAYLAVLARSGGDVAPARACVDRLRGIAEAVRELAALEDPPAAADVAAALARGGAATDGAARAWIAPRALARLAASAVAAVARAAPDGAIVRAQIAARDGRVTVRLAAGAPPAAWRAVDPFGDARLPLDLWLAALIAGAAGGGVRIADADSALELDLPAAEPAP